MAFVDGAFEAGQLVGGCILTETRKRIDTMPANAPDVSEDAGRVLRLRREKCQFFLHSAESDPICRDRCHRSRILIPTAAATYSRPRQTCSIWHAIC